MRAASCDEKFVSGSYLRVLNREFDRRLANINDRQKPEIPPSPKQVAALPWSFETVYPIFTIREHGSRAHQSGHDDGRRRWWPKPIQDQEGHPATYRHLVKNGKPVPLTQQVQLVPPVDIDKPMKFNNSR